MIRFLTIAYILTASTAFAKISEDTADQIHKMTNTLQVLDNALVTVEAEADRYLRGLIEVTDVDKANAERVKSIARRIYVAKNLYSVYRIVYSRRQVDNAAQDVLNFYKTDHGQKLLAADAESSSSDLQARVNRYLKGRIDKLKKNRKNTIRTYIRSTRRVDEALLLDVYGNFAARLGFNSLKPQGRQEPYAKVLKRAKGERTRYVARAQKNTFARHVFLFRNFNSKEIDAVSRYATSTTGTRHYNSHIKALEKTLEKAAQTLANTLAQSPTSPKPAQNQQPTSNTQAPPAAPDPATSQPPPTTQSAPPTPSTQPPPQQPSNFGGSGLIGKPPKLKSKD